MEENDFLSPLQNAQNDPKKLPKEFSYTKYAFKKYESACGDGKMSIYAVADTKEEKKNVSRDIVCKDYDMLCSMLSLRKAIRTVFESATPTNDERVDKKRVYKTINIDKTEDILNTGIQLNPEAIEEIKSWCVKYGYPFNFDAVKYSNAGQQRLLLRKGKGHIPAGFMLSDFLIHLNEIYYAFQLCRVISGHVQSQSLIGEVTRIFSNDYRLLSKNHFEKIREITPERCMEIFSQKYSERNYRSNIFFDESNHAHIRIHAENLFDAAYYQLALFLNEPKMEIRECSMCGKYFEITDARQKYCENKNEFGVRTCYAQKAFKRKKLAEERQKRTGE